MSIASQFTNERGPRLCITRRPCLSRETHGLARLNSAPVGADVDGGGGLPCVRSNWHDLCVSPGADSVRRSARASRDCPFAFAQRTQMWSVPRDASGMAKRVLILDDEPVTTRTLILDLSEAGYEVDRAADADEVVRKFNQRAFDLLIASDCCVGTVDGTELVAACRRARPTAKVLLMTTEGIREGRVELSDIGARVRKPFDLEEFRAVVARVLGVGRRKTRGVS